MGRTPWLHKRTLLVRAAQEEPAEAPLPSPIRRALPASTCRRAPRTAAAGPRHRHAGRNGSTVWPLVAAPRTTSRYGARHRIYSSATRVPSLSRPSLSSASCASPLPAWGWQARRRGTGGRARTRRCPVPWPAQGATGPPQSAASRMSPRRRRLGCPCPWAPLPTDACARASPSSAPLQEELPGDAEMICTSASPEAMGAPAMGRACARAGPPLSGGKGWPACIAGG